MMKGNNRMKTYDDKSPGQAQRLCKSAYVILDACGTPGCC